jgi:peptide/nickel transport system permease protein
MGSPLGIAWRRYRRNRLAVGSLAFVVVAIALCFPGAPLLAKAFGHGPDDPFPYAVSLYLKPDGLWSREPNLHEFVNAEEYDVGRPKPPPGTATTLLILGGDGPLGRDELLRLLQGGRVSLEVALGGTLLAALLGTVIGASGALAGGWLDSLVGRVSEFVMAFPLLLLLIMVGSTSLGDALDGLSYGALVPRGVTSLVLVIALFTWFYPARVVRTQVLSLREREFVDAAEMVGASQPRIVRTHLVPHVMTSLLAYATALFATNVMLEAGVSFLGAGIKLPTASWGNMLAESWGSVLNPTPDLGAFRHRALVPTLAPSIAIFLTVFAFNQVAEGLRTAVLPTRR